MLGEQPLVLYRGSPNLNFYNYLGYKTFPGPGQRHSNSQLDTAGLKNGATGHFAMVNGRQKLSDLQQNPPNLEAFGGNQLGRQGISAKSEDNLLQAKTTSNRKMQNGGKIIFSKEFFFCKFHLFYNKISQLEIKTIFQNLLSPSIFHLKY